MKIKVTGYIDISPDEFDAGPSGPLTNEAFEEYLVPLMSYLDDVQAEVDDD